VDEHRSPAERVLDVVVFGPAGLALTAAEEFPKLVDKGRHHLENQVRTARLVGQVAFQMGQRQISQLVSQRLSKPEPDRPDVPGPAAKVPHIPTPPYVPPAAPTAVTPSDGATTEVTVSGSNGNGSSRPLAIPGYDSLSASQVVQRLAGLSRPELIDVRDHEQSHRHRRTILNRVEQLLAGVDAD
jgi:hypothetical protein